MERTWTSDQQKVIDARNCSVLVSAAAGSGKTAVLVERIIKMVTDEENPVDIDRILVVTFTRAAAREMKERIYESLAQKSAKDPDNLRLSRQMTLAFGAPISTIDSFASALVGSYYYSIGLTPEIRMGDEGELRLLAETTMDEMLEDEYEKGEEAFRELSLAYRNREKDSKLVSLIFTLHQNAMSHPYPEKYLDTLLIPYQVESEEEVSELPAVKELFYQAGLIINEAIEMEKSMIEELKECSGEKEHPYISTFGADRVQLSFLSEAKDYGDLVGRFMGFGFPRLSSKKADFDDSDIRSLMKDKRESIKKSIEDLSELFQKSTSDILAEIKIIRGQLFEIIRLTKRYGREFLANKLQKKIMDFSDLEHYALDILIDKETKEPTEVARSLRRFYHEVMVDEYQDSNYLQELILSAVCDTRSNYFMVGDVKQSIYGFRQARPDIFTGKYESYSEGEGDQRRIDLSLNFRSRRDILDITNETFSLFMDKKIGLVDYDDKAALSCGADYPEKEGMESELYLIPNDDPALDDEKIDAIELEARTIGQRIRRLRAEDGFRLSDMVILHRNANKVGEKIAKVLSGMGILAELPSRSGYFNSPEVEVILALLSVISNPYDDIALCAVLNAPFFGFNKDELLMIRNIDKEKEFAEVFMDGDMSDVSEKLREKRERFIALLEDFRERSKTTPIDELLEYIYDMTGYVSYVSALRGGAERKANLEVLSDMASSYSKTSYQGIYHFIRYIEKLRKYEIDTGISGTQGADECISIMTIHKSKGLEYPVVFICGMGDVIVKKMSENIFHPKYGMGLLHYDPQRSVKYKPFYRNVIGYLLRNEIMGEEMRVLYVAMTRAKEKLIMTASYKDADIDKKTEADVPGDGTLPLIKRLAANSYGDYLIPVFLRAKRKAFMKKVSVPLIMTGEVVFEAKRKNRSDLIKLLTTGDIDNDISDEILSKTSFVYNKNTGYPWKSKYSVSVIKHAAMENNSAEDDIPAKQLFEEEKEELPYVPKFMGRKENNTSGALRGTAMHRFLECFDFGLENAAAKIDGEIKRQSEMGLLPEEQSVLLSKSALSVFFKSNLYSRMQKAYMDGNLKREQAFVMGGAPEEFFYDIANDPSVFSKEDPMVIVQGIIDAYFIEDNKIYIVDYKTDRIKTEEELINKYKKQMRLYADALGRALKLPVGGAVLYSFSLNKTVEVGF
ncbi:MAG: helicase-exonuclease AddAB subunit AddA [Lachnospiraceae bacterium]|nr:helicase-exonuclease AddAB subunit AddA [Lachnospiraceae bacterium]